MFDKYTIKPNDNLQDIAKKFNVLPDVLLDINNIYFPDELRVGMEIIVPKNKEQYLSNAVPIFITSVFDFLENDKESKILNYEF